MVKSFILCFMEDEFAEDDFMGLKGRIAWHVVAKKIDLDSAIAMLLATFEYLMEREGDAEKATVALWNLGRKAGARMLTKYAEHVGKHAVEFYEFAKTYDFAYYFYTGKKFDKVTVIPEEGKIVYEDYGCPLCKGVLAPKEIRENVRLCILIDGIFTEVCQLRGFNAESWETRCRAAGHECCRHELRLID